MTEVALTGRRAHPLPALGLARRAQTVAQTVRQVSAAELKQGERVMLIDAKDRHYLITLREGAEFHTHAGIVQHNDIVGALEGSLIRGSTERSFLALRPTLSDVVLKMPRGAQVIYPKDLGTILMQAFPTVAAYWIGPELRWIVPAAIVARLISTILFFVVAMTAAVPAMPRFIDWRVTQGLFATGTWFSLASILGTLFSTMDKFFIASLVGPSAVAHYSVPESVVRRASLIPLAMVRPLFPRLASLEETASRLLAQRSLELLILIITPIAVVAILGVRTFLELWVGQEFSQVSAPVGALIALGLWFNSVAFIPEASCPGWSQKIV